MVRALRFTAISALSLLFLPGCLDSPSNSTADSSTAGAPGMGSHASESSAEQGTRKSGPTAGGSENDGISGTPGTSNAGSTPVETPSSTEAPDSSPKKPVHELLVGITNAQLITAFDSSLKILAETPESIPAQLQYINALQSVGHERIRMGESDQAYRTFALSATAARQMLAAKPAIPPTADSLLAGVFYNDACAASLGNDEKAALAALEESIHRGFNDFDLLEQDADLKLVRANADFPHKIAQWKQAILEIARQKVRQEMAEFESFPFDFSLTDVQGKPLSLPAHQGKVLIVDVWGTWCPPCRAEIPSFVKLQQTYGDRGFQMIGLNKERQSGPEGEQLIKSFMQENKMNYPCALIDDATHKQIPDFQGYPTTLFLDRSGKVRLKAVGLHPYSYLESIVQTLLDEKVPAASAGATSAAAPGN